MSDCYCVCHTDVSSCPACEHCEGINPVGFAIALSETQESVARLIARKNALEALLDDLRAAGQNEEAVNGFWIVDKIDGVRAAWSP